MNELHDEGQNRRYVEDGPDLGLPLNDVGTGLGKDPVRVALSPIKDKGLTRERRS